MPESGVRVGDDGARRKKGNKVPRVVDILDQLPTPGVAPANEQDWRVQVKHRAQAVRAVNLAHVDQGTPASIRLRAHHSAASNLKSSKSLKWGRIRVAAPPPSD